MLSLEYILLTQMYVEERLNDAARERMLREVERARRSQRERLALKVRLGRTLVSVGQRLEMAGAA